MKEKRFIFTKQPDSFCNEYKIISATSHVCAGWLERTEPDGWKFVSNAWLSIGDIVEILDFMRGLQLPEEREE